uniref:Uncharacterized protein n=1 Tax=Siphoviridae sp. ctiJm4 TaxID=2827916 RepID=A0A8S5T0V4_9CAUD|nr:MAG TPA: hypothetical protein [Siphoviridae sp. ctiJm4]
MVEQPHPRTRSFLGGWWSLSMLDPQSTQPNDNKRRSKINLFQFTFVH